MPVRCKVETRIYKVSGDQFALPPLTALLFQVIRTSSLTSVLIVLCRCLRGLIGGGFLTSGTVSNQICWLLLDLPGLPAADHYNVYVLFIYNIDFDCNVYIPLLFTV